MAAESARDKFLLDALESFVENPKAKALPKHPHDPKTITEIQKLAINPTYTGSKIHSSTILEEPLVAHSCT